MDWTKRRSLKLIELYRERPILWDPTLDSYMARRNKLAVWKEIADQLKIDVYVAKRKMDSLLASFRRERQRDGTIPPYSMEVYRSKWYGFKSMAFLLNLHKRKKTKTTNETSEKESISTDEQSERVSTDEQSESVSTDEQSKSVWTDEQSETTIMDSIELPAHPRTTAEKTEKESNLSERDECNAYGEYVGIKLKTFDVRARANLIYEINCLIFKTETNIQTQRVEEPRATSLYPVPGPGYQQNQSNSHDSFYQQPSPTYLPQTNDQYPTEASPCSQRIPTPTESDEDSLSSVYQYN